MYGIIYCAYNKVNGKRYIGQTIQLLCQRKGGHYNNDANNYFHRALRKYKREDFEWKIIDSAFDKEDLDNKEIFWIDFFETTNSEKGYNILSGGQAGQSYSKTDLENKKEKYNKFLKESSGNRKDFKLSSKIPVRCVETKIVYDSCSDAKRKTGISASSIGRAIKGTLHTAGGYHWEILSREEQIQYSKNSIYCQENQKSYINSYEACEDLGLKSMPNALYKKIQRHLNEYVEFENFHFKNHH